MELQSCGRLKADRGAATTSRGSHNADTWWSQGSRRFQRRSLKWRARLSSLSFAAFFSIYSTLAVLVVLPLFSYLGHFSAVFLVGDALSTEQLGETGARFSQKLSAGHAPLRRLEEPPTFYDENVPFYDEQPGLPDYRVPEGASTSSQQSDNSQEKPKTFDSITSTIFSQVLVFFLIAVTVLTMVLCVMAIDVPRQFEEKPLQLNKEY